MKSILNCLIITLLLLTASGVQAQKPMPKEGYWVVESNVHTPKKATVYFYNNQHQLLYKEAVTHMVVDITKAKTRRHLNAVLDQSLAAWKRDKGRLLASRLQ